MRIERAAALLYTAVTAVVVAFQIALAAGAPWGAYAMGGAVPGQFPPELRVAALIQAVLLVGLAVIVLSRADLVATWSRASHRLIWFAVAFATVGLVLNLITPSPGERAIWAPVTLVMLVTSLLVAVRSSAVGRRRT